MKKILSFMILSIVFSAFQVSVNYGSDRLKEIQENKKLLQDNMAKLEDAIKDIKKAHKQVDKDLLKQIDKAIKKEIGEPKKQMNQIASFYSKIPSFLRKPVLDVVHLGNLIQLVEKVMDLLNFMEKTLKGIQGDFKKLANQIDPDKDPKKIYANYNQALEDFQTALNNLEKVEDLLKAMS